LATAGKLGSNYFGRHSDSALDDGVGDTSVLQARRMEYALLVADMSNPYFGVGRYVRPIDSSFRFWLHEGAADGSSFGRCNQRT
jgi:hypothetical protein